MKQDYILLILNCYKYESKANIQRSTWLRKLPSNITYFHVIGDIEKCNGNAYLIDYEKHILYVSTKDDYNSLPHKVISAFHAINDSYDFKYIFKTDDDQKLIKDDFFEKITKILSFNSKCHYGGTLVSVEDHISQYYHIHNCLPKNLLLKKTSYCNGRFYLLSKYAIENLLQKYDKIKEHYIEDHAIGLYLDDKYKDNMFPFNSKDIFQDRT
tara:strand:+ start:534 stop:1169 length:636 start_codon:yes stop_codon:yes gene_type:complete